MHSHKCPQTDKADERLVEEIWDNIAEEVGCFELSEVQKEELDRHLESFRGNPSQGRTWDQIQSEFLNAN